MFIGRVSPNVVFATETNVLKKFVKAAGFGLDHVNVEFASGDLLNKPITYQGVLRSRCYERFSSHLSLFSSFFYATAVLTSHRNKN
jgi:hypothetical protein